MTVEELLEQEGYLDLADMLEGVDAYGSAPAFCTNEGCKFSDYYEPDAHGIECPDCGTRTVESVLVNQFLI